MAGILNAGGPPPAPIVNDLPPELAPLPILNPPTTSDERRAGMISDDGRLVYDGEKWVCRCGGTVQVKAQSVPAAPGASQSGAPSG